jgi:hypothetical protein
VITTPELIDRLVGDAVPVRRLRPPVVRAGLWLVLAAVILGLLASLHGIRSDLFERLHQPIFVVGFAASLATGVLAAIASFIVSLPDRPRGWALLPLPTLFVWASTIGYGCLTDWIAVAPEGLGLGEAARCFLTLLVTSVPLSAAMLAMVRYAAPLRPAAVTMIGGLAVAAITSAALSLFHDIDATVMVLIWNVGAALLVVAFCGIVGRRMFARTGLT